MYQRAMHFLLTSARRWLEKPAALNHDAMSTELELGRPGILACCKEVIVLKLAGPNSVRTDGFFFLAKSNYGVASSSCARTHAITGDLLHLVNLW